MGTIQDIDKWSKSSVTLKLFAVGFFILVLLVPTGMIRTLIFEREGRRASVVGEIVAGWAGQQSLRGPILAVPTRRTIKQPNGSFHTVNEVMRFIPDTLDIQGTIDPEIRKRGIFKEVLYNSALNISGEFAAPKTESASEEFFWDRATVEFGMSDLRGIKDNLSIQWNGKSIPFAPGIGQSGSNSPFVVAAIPIDLSKPSPLPFKISLALKGSRSFGVVPVGKKTSVELNSTWPHPSFTGVFLPDEREVTDKGFSAKWNVLYFNRNLPERWVGAYPEGHVANFGVDLLFPIDHYSNVTRAIKYAVMFVFLTFLVFFFIEFFNKKRMHPIQYLLVGGALVLFYLLLLSLSEHIPFTAAYLIASIGVVALIVGYAHAVFQRGKVTCGVAAVLGTLYAFLYSLLQMEDYSLLIGSLGLFAILAVVMYLTRKIDWYATAEA